MLRKSRIVKMHLPQGEMNVVSLMDILTTLLFFLLIASSFIRLSGVDASGFLHPNSVSAQDDKKPVFTLEIVVSGPNNASIWLGPLTGLKITDEKALRGALQAGFKGNDTSGFTQKVSALDFPKLMAAIQQAVVPIKRSFPYETGAVVAFTDRVTYQQLVDAVSALRALDDKHDGLIYTNAIGQREKTKVLFPSLTISEWADEGASEGGSS